MDSLKRHINTKRFFYIASFVLLLMLYGRTLGYEYVWDDAFLLVNNPAIVSHDLRIDLLSRPLFENVGYFRPLVFFSWWLETRLWGDLNPYLSHTINLLFFYGLIIIVFNLINLLIKSKNIENATAISAICLFIYMAHPANVETIVWIAGRFDLFATFFIFLTIYIFVRMKHSYLRDLLIILTTSCALLSKETGVLLLVLLPIMYLYTKQNGEYAWSKLLDDFYINNRRMVLGILLISCIYFITRFMVTGHSAYHLPFDMAFIKKYYIEYQAPIISIQEYITRTVFPFLNNGYFNQFTYQSDTKCIYSWLVVIAFLATLIYLLRKRNNKAMLLLAYLVGISLVVNLIPLNRMENVRQDRFLFVSTIFFIILLSQLIANLFNGKNVQNWKPLLIFSYTIAMAVATSVLMGIWRDEDVFWERNNNIFKSEYADGQRVLKLYFYRLVAKPEVDLNFMRDILTKEKIYSARTGKKLELMHFTNYARVSIRDRGEEEGLLILEEIMPAYENKRDDVGAERERILDIVSIYSVYVEGLIYVRHDFNRAKEYVNRIKNIDPEEFNKNVNLIRLDMVVNLLLDKPQELKIDLALLKQAKQSLINDKTPVEQADEFVDFLVGELCPVVKANVPACQPNFSMQAYREKLANE